jgi:hypothetical protein
MSVAIDSRLPAYSAVAEPTMFTITNPPADSLAGYIIGRSPPAEKDVPAFYIFEDGANGAGRNRVGAAYAHKNGKGFTILIGGRRYAAFPPKRK